MIVEYFLKSTGKRHTVPLSQVTERIGLPAIIHGFGRSD
jgi:hypothetical protein